ncbi:GlcG/HbpS family heme-binding protein [Nisaea sp.]|uniref:GlcG/HbpS family heme-binding protein n=1 Tax=Nisaea sp. TaxID=2024842 RepID=UPI003B5224B5
MAGNFPLKVTLPLAKAEIIADEALRVATEEKMLPMTVVVLDAGGQVVCIKRQDGSGIGRVEIATAKAWGGLGFGESSRNLGVRLKERLGFQVAAAAAFDGRMAAVPGGAMIMEDGAIVGAVGVSGDLSEKDEYCAARGIQKAGYTSEPAELDESWR